MEDKQYLIIENNVVVNNVVWDGGPEWTPPAGSIQLIKDITPALIWVHNNEFNVYELKEVIGAGEIGFTWNGTTLITNEPDPN